MFPILPFLLLIGTIIAWIGLMLSWAHYIHDVTERRRIVAVAQGETPPDIKGVSNYERADLREKTHRAMKITPHEKWIGRALFFGVPVIIFIVFLKSTQL